MRQESMRQKICTIENDIYYIIKYFDSPNNYLLVKNKKFVATISVIRVEYENWKGYQVKHKISLYFDPNMDFHDKIALEDAIEFVNGLNLDYSKFNF